MKTTRYVSHRISACCLPEFLYLDRFQVLMMQEAKSSCAGQWYLPAGRMEPGEDIGEAAKREVLEETGLEIELTTLLLVETAAGSWYRFVVTGSVIGGKLKTPADADSESLQAKWIGDLTDFPLRAGDVLPLIEVASTTQPITARGLSLGTTQLSLL